MASTSANPEVDSIETDVYHDGSEVAVRSRSQHSRAAHIPDTDSDGNVVFDDDGNPRPECDVETDGDATDWVLRPVRNVSTRDKCRRCFDAEEVANQNKANGGSKTFARIARHGSDWGTE